MKKYIKPLTMGDFLEEYMKPLHLSAYKLANAIHVPVSRIQDILHGRRKMSIDTSMRLGRYFGIHEVFFFRVQLELDYRKARYEMRMELEKIKAIDKEKQKLLKGKDNIQSELDSIIPIGNNE